MVKLTPCDSDALISVLQAGDRLKKQPATTAEKGSISLTGVHPARFPIVRAVYKRMPALDCELNILCFS
jgi:hypothetical protein